MTEPEKTTQEDEVDDSSEQILNTETNNIHVQVIGKQIYIYSQYIHFY